ncbi:MAG: thiamine-phosphate synthase family protein [Methanocorpusculum sp.]|nr:thiamine-phosphate synthase family protein [Methanocorpusculum sp.]
MGAKNQSAVLRDLQQAHGKILDISRYMIPKGGVRIAYATFDAKDTKDVAVAANESVGFGIDEPITRIILTVMRFDPEVRAAVNIKLNDDIYQTVKETFIEVEKYDVAKYPKGISTMEWGVSFICKNGVPLAIAAENEPVTGGSIYILGTTPEEAANRILIISERLQL